MQADRTKDNAGQGQ